MLSKQKFKSRVSDSIDFEFLLNEKYKLKKVSHIEHKDLKIQKYLLLNSTSVKMARFIFHARNRMLDAKVNYKNKNYVDMFCSTCRDPNTEDSQEHLLQCVSLKNQNTVLSVPDVPKYKDLFRQDITKLVRISSILSENFNLRKQILKQSK